MVVFLHRDIVFLGEKYVRCAQRNILEKDLLEPTFNKGE
jgi:hypothetical protein